MNPLSIETLRQVTAARSITAVAKDLVIQSINTDTRKTAPGSLFVAISGERFDGHDFILRAAESGAVTALVERDISDLAGVVPILRVDSTRAALGKLARHVRLQFRGQVIAVAGSNGKTSTKFLIHAALSAKLRGSMSPKSFNNDIGVPLTIFDAEPHQDFLVLEMGTNHPGEIRSLAQIGVPDIALITNCGEEHLEFLGDVAGVRRENASIIEGLRERGTLVVNGDDAELIDIADRYGARRITFGFDPRNDLFAADVLTEPNGVRFKLNGRHEYFVPLIGRHNACNALGAIAVARRMGLKDDEIAKGLASASGPEMRMEMKQVAGVQLLNDAYNANPASMRAALDTISSMTPVGRRIAVLGDMRELGDVSEQYHREIGSVVASAGIDVLACVGAQASVLAESAANSGLPREKIHCFVDSTAASKVVPRWLRAGDLVLLKGSRGVRLEVVARGIEAAMADAD